MSKKERFTAEPLDEVDPFSRFVSVRDHLKGWCGPRTVLVRQYRFLGDSLPRCRVYIEGRLDGRLAQGARPGEWACDCPDALAGEDCAHLAAVLCAVKVWKETGK